MIATVTLNPAIDFHIGISQFSEGTSFSASDNAYFAGGKGINVSRVLKNMHSQTTAFAMIGGFTGDFILSQANDIISPIYIQDTNRINTKLKTATQETEIHGVAPKISSQEFNELCTKIQSMDDLDFLIMSGSIPNSMSIDSYQQLATICKPTTKIVLDTRGNALKSCLALESIFLLKPNKDEIGELFDCTVNSNDHALSLAQELKHRYSIQHLILSLGSEGAFFLFEDSIYYAESLKGELISSVGAGDSVVAGFVSQYTKTQDPLQAFQFGIACGAGTAFSQGLCTLELATELFKKVMLTKIK